MSSPEPIRPAPRRRWYLWLLVLLLVPVLIFAVQWGVRKSLAERDLEEAIAETDRLDPGWKIADLLAARKAIEKNSVPKILEAARLLDKAALNDPRLNSYFLSPQLTHRLNAQQAEALQEMLNKNAKALESARAIRDYPQGRFPIDYAGDFWAAPELQRLRDVVQLLNWDVRGQLHAERPTEAAHSCLAMLYASRSASQEPMLMAQLIRLACSFITVAAIETTLAQVEVPLAQLEILQRALAEAEEDNLLLIAYRGERATTFQQFENIRTGKVSMSKVMTGKESAESRLEELLLTLRRPGSLQVEEAECLRRMTARVEACKLPVEQIKARVEELEAFKPALERGKLGTLRLSSLSSMAVDLHVRHLAMVRCCQAAIAAERFRQQHKSWPGTLQKLVDTGLLAALLIDPYNGKPMRLLARGDGLVIYSVHKNLQDDRGAVTVGPVDFIPLDVGIQLWDVKSRRSAPLPPVAKEKEREGPFEVGPVP